MMMIIFVGACNFVDALCSGTELVRAEGVVTKLHDDSGTAGL